MSSTILHPAPSEPAVAGAERHPVLVALGERLRRRRAELGLPRKAVAAAADMSERHLANLESGTGNASILVLLQVAAALRASVAELTGAAPAASPERQLLEQLLDGRDEAALRRARLAVAGALGDGTAAATRRSPRVALIGLRGAGKTTLGRRLAEDLGFAFVELSRVIETLAGCSTAEIQALYGASAYRRYERRALEDTLRQHAESVIATPGGVVTDPAAFNLLLTHCTTVWLRAAPEDHMKRVVAQGDMRPMAASTEAMDDLKGILAGRTPFYAKADLTLDTSAQGLDATFDLLRQQVRSALQIPL